MSERFVGDGRLRLSGRKDARSTACHGIRGTRATRCHQAESANAVVLCYYSMHEPRECFSAGGGGEVEEPWWFGTSRASRMAFWPGMSAERWATAPAGVTRCIRSSSWRRLRQVSPVVFSATRINPAAPAHAHRPVGDRGQRPADLRHDQDGRGANGPAPPVPGRADHRVLCREGSR